MKDVYSAPKPTPPQMPEIIYANLEFSDSAGNHTRYLQTTPYGVGTSYTRTDLCEELKMALKDCVSALSLAVVGSCSCGTKSPDVKYHNDYCLYKNYSQALTKAQGLLR